MNKINDWFSPNTTVLSGLRSKIIAEHYLGLRSIYTIEANLAVTYIDIQI